MPWKWQADQKKAFNEAKVLKSLKLLVYYDRHKELLILTCDASPVGLGAVLAQRCMELNTP